MNIPDKYRDVIRAHAQEKPVRLGSLAQALGLEVFKSSLKPGISGLIEPSDSAPAGYRIRINRHELVERQRFTLAHEIAHFLLHRQNIGGGVVDSTMYRSSLSNRKEVEANKLASELIMPDQAVATARKKLDHLSGEDLVTALAEEFRVSKPAMSIKLGV